MFLLRLLALGFWAYFSYAKGQAPFEALNGFDKAVALSFFVAGPLLYMQPTLEAWLRRHRNLTSIALLNVFLGWTLLGWVGALIWAFKKSEMAPVEVVVRSADGSTFVGEPTAQAERPQRLTKKCPFCAEEVLLEAVKCKHCRSDLRINPLHD